MKPTIIFTIIALLSIASVYAQEQINKNLSVSLLTPSWTFRNRFVGEEVEGYVAVANSNPFPITINFSKPDDLPLRFLGNTSVVLEPNQNYTLKYRVSLNKAGTYGSHIRVTYSTEDKDVKPNSFSLTALLTFANITKRADNKITKQQTIQFPWLIIFGVFLIAFGLWIYFQGNRKL